ncbi:unnamed protein product [Adineta ricciae]|uniref:nicotinamidase n=1 Tax=Adineta ricciae TaxID=249248 RepID=A0A815DMD0_ADIRI|nr:unnamed protein product [Adineta ricciae]CAF1601561.1 unnamed protein product [Adineta ricciae]
MGNVNAAICRAVDAITDAIPNAIRPKKKSKHVNALLIVDVQYDFIDGSLALKNCPSQHQGEQVIPVINKLLDEIKFDVVVYTQDWHTPDHISFYDNLPLRAHLLAKDSKSMEELKVFDTAIFVFDDERQSRVEQILWPVHCVQHTHGAELHQDLSIVKSNKNRQVINLFKGYDSDIDSYSAFWDNMKIRETTLHSRLKGYNVQQVFIVGIATDVCVYATALHALENGYKTHIIKDACRGVDENNINLRLNELIAHGCSMIQTADVKSLI